MGKAVLPAKIKNTMTKTIGYAFWYGTMDRSFRDMPVLLKADHIWNALNQKGGTYRY